MSQPQRRRPRRQTVGILRPAREIFGVCSVADEADVVRAVHLAAEMLEPSPAHVALAAVEVRPEDDAVALFEIAAAGVRHDAAELVPHREVRRLALAPAFPAFHICTSLPQTPQAETFICISPSRASGTGTSLTSIRRGPSSTAASSCVFPFLCTFLFYMTFKIFAVPPRLTAR